MAEDDIFMPDDFMEEYNKQQKKKKEAQDSIISWNADDDIIPNIVIESKENKNPPVDTVDVKIKNGLLNMPKLKLTAEKIEKPKRKYTKKSSIATVKIVQLSKDATFPSKKYEDDACFDLYAAENTRISYGNIVKVKTGIAVQVPPGYVGKVFSRSGLASEGIFVVNAPGIIDASYTGELFVILGCANQIVDCSICKGDRIAQFTIEKVEPFTFEIVKQLDKTERGDKGIGSTGK